MKKNKLKALLRGLILVPLLGISANALAADEKRVSIPKAQMRF